MLWYVICLAVCVGMCKVWCSYVVWGGVLSRMFWCGLLCSVVLCGLWCVVFGVPRCAFCVVCVVLRGVCYDVVC